MAARRVRLAFLCLARTVFRAGNDRDLALEAMHGRLDCDHGLRVSDASAQHCHVRTVFRKVVARRGSADRRLAQIVDGQVERATLSVHARSGRDGMVAHVADRHAGTISDHQHLAPVHGTRGFVAQRYREIVAAGCILLGTIAGAGEQARYMALLRKHEGDHDAALVRHAQYPRAKLMNGHSQSLYLQVHARYKAWLDMIASVDAHCGAWNVDGALYEQVARRYSHRNYHAGGLLVGMKVG